MPSNLMMSDSSFPQFTGETTEEKVNKIQNYLYMLLEQLRYSLGNISMDNMNSSDLESLAGYITEPVTMHLSDIDGRVTDIVADMDGVFSRVSNAEGHVSTLSQTVNGLYLSVETNGSGSYIRLTSNGTSIGSSGMVDISGFVTFSSLANANDKTIINGGNIKTGKISALTFEGCQFVCSITSLTQEGLEANGQIKFMVSGFEEPVGGIRFDTKGKTNENETAQRLFLYTKNLEIAKNVFLPVPLKLDSQAGISLRADEDIYMQCNGSISLRSFGGNAVRIENARIYPYSNAWDGKCWDFEGSGIYYGNNPYLEISGDRSVFKNPIIYPQNPTTNYWEFRNDGIYYGGVKKV